MALHLSSFDVFAMRDVYQPLFFQYTIQGYCERILKGDALTCDDIEHPFNQCNEATLVDIIVGR